MLIKMQNLDAVYIRINYYPEIGIFIKKHPSIKDRTEMGNFVIIELRPEFPGGMENLGLFIWQLLEYPEPAKEKNITGTVKV